MFERAVKISVLISVFLLAAVIICGAGAAEYTTLSVIAKDAGNNYIELPGVTISLLNKETGVTERWTTDSSGLVPFSVIYGAAYQITGEKNGYITQKIDSFRIDGPNLIATLYLTKESPMTLIVKNKAGEYVSNAEVFIDGQSIGVTDSMGTAPLSVTQGKTCLIRVTHPQYESFSEQKYIDSGSSVTVTLSDISMKPYFFVCTKERKPVNGATVSINGNIVGFTASDGIARISTSIYDGKNTVTVTKTGYEIYNGEIVFSTKQNEYDIILTPVSYAVTLMISSGTSPIAGARVTIDGALAAYSDSTGKAVPVSTYTEGPHNVSITADKYSPLQQTITVTPGQTTFSFRLGATTAPVTIQVLSGSTPLEKATVCIDGKVTGVTNSGGKYNDSFTIGRTMQVSAIHDGYSGDAVTYHVGSGMNTVTVNLKQNAPVTIIAIAALGAVIVILIVIVVIFGRRRHSSKHPVSKKSAAKKSSKSSSASTSKRSSKKSVMSNTRGKGKTGGRRDSL